MCARRSALKRGPRCACDTIWVVQVRDPRRLKESLEEALQKGELEQAVDLLERLERLEQDEPRWSQRLGEVFRTLERHELAIAAYGRAIDRLARAGFTARAVAVASLIAQLDTSAGSLLPHGVPSDPRGLSEGASHVPREVVGTEVDPFSLMSLIAAQSEPGRAGLAPESGEVGTRDLARAGAIQVDAGRRLAPPARLVRGAG